MTLFVDTNLTLRIEALGRAVDSASDNRWRFSTLPQISGTSGEELFIPCLKNEFPAEIASEINFRTGNTSIGGFAIELLHHSLDYDGDYSVGQRLYRQRARPIGYLDGADVTSSATQITIVDSQGNAVTNLLASASARGLAVGREVVVINNHVGAGVYDCTRGEFGTAAQAHKVGVHEDGEVFDAEHGHLLEDREVILSRIPTNGEIGVSTDEEILYRGVLRAVSSPVPGIIRLDIASPLELLQARKLGGNPWRGWVENRNAADRPDDSQQRDTFHILGREGRVPLSRNDADGTDKHRVLLGTEEGDVAWVQKWNRGPGETWSMVFSYTQGEAIPFLDSDELARQRATDVHEIISTHPDAPDIDNSGTKWGTATVNGATVRGNLFVAFLQCLLTTPTGGNHSTYDLGDPDLPDIYENLGIGCKAALIDVDNIETLALRYRNSGRAECLHLTRDGKGVEAYDLFKGAFHALGLVMTSRTDGKLGLAELDDIGPLTTSAIVQADMMGDMTQRRRFEDTMDVLEVERVVFTESGRPTMEIVTDTYKDVINLRRLVSGRHRSGNIDATAFSDPEQLRQAIINRHVQRYHRPVPEITFSVPRRTALEFWPGDFVSVTHPLIWGRDGTRGVTSEPMLITARRYDMVGGVYRYRALWLAGAYNRTGRIPPASRVTGYTAGGGTDSSNRVSVSSSDGVAVKGPDDEVQNDDTDVWEVGDKFQVANEDLSIKDAGPFTIYAVGTGYIDTNGSFTSAPASLDYIIPCSWDDDPTASQKSKWCWMADAAETLGSSNDDPYDWVT